MKSISEYVLIFSGLILVSVGIFIVIGTISLQGALTALPYVLIGLGCGSFGHGLGNIISRKVMSKNPSIQRQIEIEKNDERNMKISNHAKAKAFDLMIYVFSTIIISLLFMNVDLLVILILIIGYILVLGYAIFYFIKYNKEM